MGPCFNCNEMGCPLKMCKQPKSLEHPKAYNKLLKTKCNLVEKSNEIQIADYVGCAESDEEYMDAFLALTMPNERAKEKEHARDVTNGGNDPTNTFHNSPEWDESQDSDDIFMVGQIAIEEPDVKYSHTETRETNQDILFSAQNLSTRKKEKKIRNTIKTLTCVNLTIR